MGQQTTLPQNQFRPTISSGRITNPITPETLDRASMLQNQKANSYSEPALPVNTKVAQQHAGSERSPSPRDQHSVSPLNTKQVFPNSDTWTAVSNWLATSQAFEKPPTPASIADPAPRERRCKKYWLQIAADLDLRMKSRSGRSEPPIYLNQGSLYAKPGSNSGTSGPPSNTLSQVKLPKPSEHPAPGQLNTSTNKAFPPLSDTMDAADKQERRRKSSIEANMSEVQEKLAKHKREQEQLEATKLKKADEAVKAKAEARKLAADAMATHKKEQGRKKYVEGRAWDIHENMLRCKPFDMDAVRQEFSEKEVQVIKKIVRELGFAKKM